MAKVCLVFKRETVGDEGVSVVHFDNDKLSVSEAAKSVPEGASYEVVEVDSLPLRDEYRNAWGLENKEVKHDMVKAREIHKEKLRALRAPKLAALDVEYQKADEADDKVKKKEIADEKQTLRDVTKEPLIDAATSVEKLKASVPSELLS